MQKIRFFPTQGYKIDKVDKFSNFSYNFSKIATGLM